MSKSTKRKHVVKEVLDDYYLPEGNESIVRVIGGRGNNLHEVQDETGEKYLVSMPTKFRKNVWIKRGDFVVVESIEEGDKVKAEIVCVLYKEQIRYIKQEGKWPSGFEEKADQEKEEVDDIFVNTNRPVVEISESESDSESEVDEDETSDDEQ